MYEFYLILIFEPLKCKRNTNQPPLIQSKIITKHIVTENYFFARILTLVESCNSYPFEPDKYQDLTQNLRKLKVLVLLRLVW